MSKAVVLLVFSLTAVAQVLPSCDGDGSPGGGPTVIGRVESKYERASDPQHVVVINGIEYAVPVDFFIRVDVGDLVKKQGGVWTIVRRGRS
jgi:hypothetical protein